jgi:hypothetical protein
VRSFGACVLHIFLETLHFTSIQKYQVSFYDVRLQDEHGLKQQTVTPMLFAGLGAMVT